MSEANEELTRSGLNIWRQDAVPILSRLVLEEIPGGHRDHTRADALGEQLVVGFHDQTYFAARSDKDQFRVSARDVSEHVRTSREAAGRGIFASVQSRQRLTRKRQHGRLVTQLHDVTIGLDDFVSVAGPQGDQPRHRTQRHQLLYGLVSRSVFSVAHRLMREDEDAGQLHQGRQAYGGPRVVAEDEESRPEWPDLR